MEQPDWRSESLNRTHFGGDWWWRALALFLTVVGARFWLVDHYSTTMPYWDQWDGIGGLILKPWLDGHLDFRSFFVPHNEHRIALTRLLSLALFTANGQWDNLLECTVNAVFMGLGAVCVAGILTTFLGVLHQRLILLAVGLYGVLPFGWENTLCGFQSQNYFLIVFSILTIWGLGFRCAGSRGWWVGAASLVLACMSAATGFVGAVAAGAAVAVRWLADRRRPGSGEVVTVLVCAAAVAVGFVTRVEVPAHASLRAENFSAFVMATLRFAAWPAYRFPLCGLIAVVPVCLLAGSCLRRLATGRRGGTPADGGLLAFGCWVLLQTAAMAYGRGGQSAAPACRYMDLLALGPLVNVLVWAALADGARGVRRALILSAATVWTALLVGGLWMETDKDFCGWLPFYRDRVQRAERNLQAYLDTGDFQRTLAGKRADDLPYPIAERLAVLLDDKLRAVLPASSRLPLVPKSVVIDGTGFQPGVHPRINGRSERAAYWNSDTADDGSARKKLTATFVAPSVLPYLRFSFAGDLGGEGLRFSLRDDASGKASDWRPARRIGERWHTDYLASPGREFTVEAVDESTTGWFAFSAPVEVGFWSYWSGYALRRGGWIFAAGIALACLVEVAALRRWWQTRLTRTGGKRRLAA